MATIITLKYGNKYSAEYVNILYSRIRHFNPDWHFCCYTENANGLDPEIEVRELDRTLGLYGWWFKIWIFAQELPGDNIFLDLDMLVLGKLDAFLPPSMPRGVGIIQNGSRINSSCVSWRTTMPGLWDKFEEQKDYHLAQPAPYGDQEILELAFRGNRGRLHRHWFNPMGVGWLQVDREGGGVRNLTDATRLIVCKGPRNPHDHKSHPAVDEYWRRP